jgi:hypothetical protein
MIGIQAVGVQQNLVSQQGKSKQALGISNITFSADAIAPSVHKEAIELRKKQEQILLKSVYEGDGECLTFYDVLKAVQKSGGHALIKPWVHLNPVKWVQWSMAAAKGDGFSNYIHYDAILKALPLKYDKRGPQEQEKLEDALFNALMILAKYELVHYGSANDHIRDVWRPTGVAKKLVKTKGIENAQAKAQRRPLLNEDIKSRFEQQIKELQLQQKKRTQELQQVALQVEIQENQYQDLTKALTDRVRQYDQLAQKRQKQSLIAKEIETQQTLADQIDILKEDAKHQKELLDTLKLQASYTETVTRQLNQQTSQFIAKIKQTLSRIEISKVNAQMLKMSGKLKEREDLERELNEQIEDANRAYITMKAAMESNNPEVYLKAMELLRQADAAVQTTPVQALTQQAKQQPTTQIITPPPVQISVPVHTPDEMLQALQVEAAASDVNKPKTVSSSQSRK